MSYHARKQRDGSIKIDYNGHLLCIYRKEGYYAFAEDMELHLKDVLQVLALTMKRKL